MNTIPTTTLGRPRSSGGSIESADAVSTLGSPTQSKVKSAKRLSNAALLDSSGSEDEGIDGRSSKRRQPGVKRACNECRQQKVSADKSCVPE